jgi:V/A-type H+-transporting ATPase subunit K
VSKKNIKVVFLSVVLIFLSSVLVFAQEASTTAGTAEQAAPARSALATGLIALAAALAIGITAIGTAIAQSRIGAAGAGTIAERPETTGTIIILIAIPETLVILGFIVSIIILFTL